MKPRLSLIDQQAYQRIAALPVGAAVTFDGSPATFTGMAGYLITLKVKRCTVYLRAGDPRIKEITI
jgi:hypothetical protein